MTAVWHGQTRHTSTTSTPSVLADTAAEAVDARTAKFLLQQTLAAKEEEEKRKLEAEEKMAQAAGRPEFAGMEEWLKKRRRKQKVRRKRRLPRTSSHFTAALVVGIGSGMFLAGVLVSVLLTLCSLRLSACPSGQPSWLVWM